MHPQPSPTWRDGVFKRRGTLLALPAVALVVFGRPTRTLRALGVSVAFAGEALRCWAVGYSGSSTRADHVTAPQLVTAGPYGYTRNPLYVGNFITALGFTLAFTGGLSPLRRTTLTCFGLGTMVGVYAAIVPLEEAYLRNAFGVPFEEYVARVPRIVPRLPRSSREGGTLQDDDAGVVRRGTYDAGVIAQAETRTFITFGAMLLALAVKSLRGRRR